MISAFLSFAAGKTSGSLQSLGVDPQDVLELIDAADRPPGELTISSPVRSPRRKRLDSSKDARDHDRAVGFRRHRRPQRRVIDDPARRCRWSRKFLIWLIEIA